MKFSPLLIVEEDRAHAWRDSPDHTNLATQPSVLMTVLDENLNRQDIIVTSANLELCSHLNIWAVPVLAAEDVVIPAGGWVVGALGAAGGHGAVADAGGGRRVAGRRRGLVRAGPRWRGGGHVALGGRGALIRRGGRLVR